MSMNPFGMSDRLHRHVRCWTPAVVAVVLAMASHPVAAAVVVKVTASDALPGGTLTLQMRVDRASGDPSIAGVQADLILSTDQLALTGTCSSDQSACENGSSCPQQGNCTPSCQIDPRLSEHSLAAAFPDFQNVPTGQRRLRLPINPNVFPPATLSDGLLVTCTFDVLSGAPFGTVVLTADAARFRVTDEAADPVAATLELQAGSIVGTLSTPTPTVTETPPTPTETSGTPTETVSSATPTETAGEATATPSLGSATETPTAEITATLVEATSTPTVTIEPTSTSTVALVTPTATNTVPVPTATTVAPTVTFTVVVNPTNTATVIIPATATPIVATATPTGGQSGFDPDDDDGCAIGSAGELSLPPMLALVAPVALLFLRRRRIR